MEKIIIMSLTYVIGFILTLITLHKTDGFWGEYNHYDPPHEGWYDDYDNNAQAYVAFSFGWPIFIFANIIAWCYKKSIKLSEKLNNKYKTSP